MQPARLNFDIEDLQLHLDSHQPHQPVYYTTDDNGDLHLFAGHWNPDTQAWEAQKSLILPHHRCHDCLGCSAHTLKTRPVDGPKTDLWVCIRTEAGEALQQATTFLTSQEPEESLLQAVYAAVLDVSSIDADTFQTALYCLKEAARDLPLNTNELLALPPTDNCLMDLIDKATEIAHNLDPDDWQHVRAFQAPLPLAS